jgi:sec-independent protein translocase protein TatC
MPIPESSSGEMPFLDHLEELRWRIIYSLIGILVGVATGLVLAFKFALVGLLQAPIAPFMDGRKLSVLTPMDAFSINIQIAFVIGFAIAAPVIGYQFWRFMSPALHAKERRIVIPVLFAAALLFISGVALVWFFVLPMSLKWLHELALASGLQPEYTASAYFGFATNLALVFGIAFEMPLLLVALNAFGIVSASRLNSSRKYAVLLIWGGSALISPGDAITITIALAIPLYLLYEMSVVIAFVIEKKRAARKAKEELLAT